MQSIRCPWSRRALAALAVPALLMLLAGTAVAREGFYLGGGIASQSVAGDLDGSFNSSILSASGTVVIVPGQLDTGTGLAILVGYGFIPLLSVEYLFARSSHVATSTFLDNSEATLSTGLIALRVNFLVDDDVELFARLGISSGIAEIKDYALLGSLQGSTFVYTSTDSTTFTGAGTGYGVGAEWFQEGIGLGASYSVLAVNFTEAEGGGVSGQLPTTLAATVTQLALTVTYNFR